MLAQAILSSQTGWRYACLLVHVSIRSSAPLWPFSAARRQPCSHSPIPNAGWRHGPLQVSACGIRRAALRLLAVSMGLDLSGISPVGGKGNVLERVAVAPSSRGGGLKVARKADTRSINSCGVARMGSPRIQPALPSVASVARLKGALGKRPTPSSRRRVLLVIRWLAPPKPRDPLPPTTPQAIGTDTGPTVDSQGAVAVTKRSSSLEISGRSDRWDHHEQICPSGLATHCNLARSSHRPFSGINLSRSPLLRYSVRYRPR